MPNSPARGYLRIRSARPSEYTGVGELTAAAYADVLTAGNDDPYRAVLLDAAARATEAELLVAVDRDDAVVGTVTVGRPGTSMAEIAHPDELEVRMLAVAAGHERQGVGRCLMQHVHDVARGEGFVAVALSVIASNTEAIAFYRHLGYLPASDRDWSPRADMLPLLVYRRNLLD